jgi:trans-aconitate 2-methyltransferase
MTENAPGPWDAGLYDSRHAFVWKHGESLLELLQPVAGERILDLGCGTGHLTARVAEAGAEVVGLDSSAAMLDQARSAYPHLEFVHGDARAFDFDRPFDAVFSNAALHWVREADAVVRCVHAALRPGGRFVAELGGRGNVAALLAAMREAAGRLRIALELPAWYFPGVAEYAGLLEAVGLEVRLALLFARPTPLEGPDGLRAWVRMFAATTLDAVPPERHEEFLRETEEVARPALLSDGLWHADYRRLRVVAVRLTAPC